MLMIDVSNAKDSIILQKLFHRLKYV